MCYPGRLISVTGTEMFFMCLDEGIFTCFQSSPFTSPLYSIKFEKQWSGGVKLRPGCCCCWCCCCWWCWWCPSRWLLSARTPFPTWKGRACVLTKWLWWWWWWWRTPPPFSSAVESTELELRRDVREGGRSSAGCRHGEFPYKSPPPPIVSPPPLR